MKEETLDLLFSMLGFNNLSCYLNADVADYSKVTHKDIISTLVTEATSVQATITDTYAVLNMDPFPFKEVGCITQTGIYDETKGEWVDGDLDMRYKWLQNIYKMLEEEAIKQGKLDTNYKEQAWFLLYKNPPKHLKKLLTSLSSQLSEYGTSLTEEIVIQNFVKESNNEEIQLTLKEGYELFNIDPFPWEWLHFIIASSIVSHSIKNAKDRDLQKIYYHQYPKLYTFSQYTEFLKNLLDTLKQEATTQGKL